MKKNLGVIILAAGKGTRMKSALPKVLHPICGRPILKYVLDLAKDLKSDKTVAVLGYQHAKVKSLLPAGIRIAVQEKLLGTADAVKQALFNVRSLPNTILILYADNPLLKKETIKQLLTYHCKNNLDATLLTAVVDKPSGYGRILRDKYSSISAIVEEKDADDCQKEIKEINSGIICFKKEKLIAALKQVRSNNRKREYYLTDTIGILYQQGALIDSVQTKDADEILGINSRVDLARANQIIQKRINEDWMKKGVTIIDPATTFINYGAQIGEDSIIYPFTVIERDVKIGKCCSIGPFARVRMGTFLGNDVHVGNFVEIVNSKISDKTQVKHFSYLGDSRIGRSVNIGAGVVTANYDGTTKHISVIGDQAFIGSDTVMVAPVKIGRAAKTGAGAVLTKGTHVAPGGIVVGVPAKPLKKR